MKGAANKMVILSILTFQNINGLNGSAKFVKQFQEIKTKFGKNIKVNIYSDSGGFSNEEAYIKSKKYKVKVFVKKLLSTTTIGTKISVKRQIENSAQKVVNQYFENINKNTSNVNVVIFNDPFVMFQYFSHKDSSIDSTKTIFMMHNNGEPLKMFFDRFPKLINEKEKADKIILSLLCKVSRIVFVSEKARLSFCKQYPKLKEKTRTIYIGHIDDEKLSSCDNDNLNIISVGSISDRKNQIGIIKAIEDIRDSSIHYTAVGGGEALEKCKSYISGHGLENRVSLVGSKKNVKEYLCQSNLFISNSLDEGLPISAQEAMECGLPLILTDVGGCSELINGNGILINNDQGELMNAISYMNDHKNELALKGKISRQLFLELFTIDKMIERYEELINELIAS